MKTEHPHKCLSVLGNKVRCSILEELIKSPLTVKQLCKKLNKEQSVISHALQPLKECSFVDCKKKGKEREYFISSPIFTKNSNKPLFELIEEHVKKNCTSCE